jgi:uncharacterized membrane protein
LPVVRLRLWPVFVLGDRFSGLVAIQPKHALVTAGIYGVIRHPSYLGLFVNSLGWGLAFRSGVGVVLTVLLIPPLLARIGAEERMLRAQFGDEYHAYCAPDITAGSLAVLAVQASSVPDRLFPSMLLPGTESYRPALSILA